VSEFSHVLDSLGAMTQPQLLAAFIACGAYALAQSALLQSRARQLTWLVAGAAAAMFILQSSEWPQATILCALAVAGLGVFTAMAWLTSRWLGVAEASDALQLADLPAVPAALAASPAALSMVSPAVPPTPTAPEPLPQRVRVRRKAYSG
jgi:hypothetical protein